MTSAEDIVIDMPSESQRHLRTEEIEKYSAGGASDDETARWDEHLLVCGECRRLVSGQDNFRTAMRSAARGLRQSEQRTPLAWRWIPLWVPATAAVAALLVAAIVFAPRWNGRQAPFAVTLTTARGPAIAAQAPERRPLSVAPDLTGLPRSASYRLEVVDAVGRPVWQGEYSGGAGRISLPGLSAGVYFARINSQGGTLLREYALEIGRAR
jgi:hypothetical protein